MTRQDDMDTADTRTADVLAALPADLDRDAPRAPDLGSMLAHLAHRPVPVGRWHRFWILTTLQARIGAGYLAHWLRSGFADADAREASLNEARLSAALKLLGGMSYLRGAAMKAGQTLASWPDVVPQEVADILKVLHFEAPPMHFALLREHVHDELGGDPTELFAEFETEAFAAASLGQVHRARLHSGEQVAVKIQYPGISRSIHSDLENVQLLMQPMRLGKNWANLMAQLADIRAMLDLEMDYVNEAAMQRQARELVADVDGLVVPRVHERYSTRRVLTTDYVDGKHLDAWLADGPDAAERTRRGEHVLTSLFRMWYSGDLVYADPHPGNYLFMPDGRTALLDFGAVYRLDAEGVEYCLLADRGLAGDPEAQAELIARSTEVERADDLAPDHRRLIEDLCAWIWEPIHTGGPFDFSDPAYFRRGADLWGEVMRKRYTRSKPMNTWFNRNFYGARALMARMGATVDMGRIHAAEVARAGI